MPGIHEWRSTKHRGRRGDARQPAIAVATCLWLRRGQQLRLLWCQVILRAGAAAEVALMYDTKQPGGTTKHHAKRKPQPRWRPDVRKVPDSEPEEQARQKDGLRPQQSLSVLTRSRGRLASVGQRRGEPRRRAESIHRDGAHANLRQIEEPDDKPSQRRGRFLD